MAEDLAEVVRRVAREHGTFDLSWGSCIESEPELGLLAMRHIEYSSSIETKITSLLAHFLKLDFVVAFDMLHAIHSGPTQREVIVAAAKRALGPEDFTLFKAVLGATRPIAQRRNQFCHWIWATSYYVPKALILLDPKRLQNDEARFIEASTLQQTPGSARVSGLEVWNSGLVFRQPDLEADMDAARLMDHELSTLASVIRDPDGPHAESGRAQLRRNPLIAATLR